MKKQNLTEEIYRMRKLMNFDSKEFNENTTSEDMLIEENFINEQKRTKGWKFALKFWIKILAEIFLICGWSHEYETLKCENSLINFSANHRAMDVVRST